ncbi:hypothetical protein PpBr36_07546 [Pyricularia pennisetigena]|uniref:hypothetical protein n=1 Tax=Pyricularia pennisetigena TaxID=1578925 RepID=UPI0011518DBC|nr:hypothetical protein PpBr36_07546 [Pyricularia pennisetigena]TLS25495.1 hypothetical protein PpBr36_07546 [Pyricularia pennisetigena]
MTEAAKLESFPTLFSLEGKVAVVTGGSRGLGLSAASGLLQAGCSKVFITSRKASACDSACAALNALPGISGRAVSVPSDSATEAGVKRLLELVSAHTDHVDILLANAGASWGAPFDDHPDDAFAKVMDLNVRAVFNTVRLFAPLLQKRATVEDPSRVIITASVAGLGIGTLGKNGTYGYSASKAAVLHLGNNLAVELGPRHITVNSIAPGFFPSKMANGLLEASGGADKIAQANPMRRLGRPEDIAGVVVYLASRAGSHVNGACIAIDGGAMWQRGELMLEAKL